MPAPAWIDRLEAVAVEHGLPAGAVERLRRLLELVRDDPTAPTAVTDPEAALDAHLADSLDGLRVPEIRQARSIADLGSGAGFPGIPLAVALPDARIHLVESLSRKCAFLERAVDVAATPNAEVACARAEQWPVRDLDVVCARAVAPLAVLLEYAAPLLRSGGAFVAWKGRPEPAEERAASAAAAILGLDLGEVHAVPARPDAEHRSLYVYLKVGETPQRFPRRAGMARKRPLSA